MFPQGKYAEMRVLPGYKGPEKFNDELLLKGEDGRSALNIISGLNPHHLSKFTGSSQPGPKGENQDFRNIVLLSLLQGKTNIVKNILEDPN